MCGAEPRVEEEYTHLLDILRYSVNLLQNITYLLYLDTPFYKARHFKGHFLCLLCFTVFVYNVKNCQMLSLFSLFSGHNKGYAPPGEFSAGDNSCHGRHHKSELTRLYGGDIQV